MVKVVVVDCAPFVTTSKMVFEPALNEIDPDG